MQATIAPPAASAAMKRMKLSSFFATMRISYHARRAVSFIVRARGRKRGIHTFGFIESRAVTE